MLPWMLERILARDSSLFGWKGMGRGEREGTRDSEETEPRRRRLKRGICNENESSGIGAIWLEEEQEGL